jgi:hypothetical protein
MSDDSAYIGHRRVKTPRVKIRRPGEPFFDRLDTLIA